mmetsp:Transcript_64460/g.135244  ORF Transcript_64460/g.135244 Transcript_64460/m.135244 type:complete len:231 (+) Transcript_64460:145-837(+)|eukprot:CAMPEP_0194782266 /NCGR_PEP_ID=MMETSP0323_2-20130528/78540_1 /TAXON_ID=2866 ORGANISM="Crypthecodinium cohnii, Strain Seligo" /NCGR_SAMPLE_ID=MMETSP0323_2 /ASSEMBLY_ACC=CAM_ASM_000346 /LENGTH=230 /DNA_ID=CAMNT_0039721055 /DNA_START=47 /DNA_END=739 /DNA_ORIENTATION=+
MAPTAAELLQKNAERGRDPKKGAEVFRPPPEVEAYFKAIDEDGKKLAESSDWWQSFLKENCGEAGEWVRGWPVHAKYPEVTEGYCHREIAPMHFVMGRLSPLYIERSFSKDRKRAAWGVYFGPFCSNGDMQMGVGMGGAISAVLDLMTANLAILFTGGMTPTASISVKMLKPVLPMPGFFRADAWVEKVEGNKIFLNGSFSDGKGKIFDTCEAVLGIVSKKPSTPPQAKL